MNPTGAASPTPTLPGHPEAGMEAFLLTRSGAAAIIIIRAMSGRLGQRLITERYLRALDR